MSKAPPVGGHRSGVTEPSAPSGLHAHIVGPEILEEWRLWSCGAPVVRRSPGLWEVWGSLPGQTGAAWSSQATGGAPTRSGGPLSPRHRPVRSQTLSSHGCCTASAALVTHVTCSTNLASRVIAGPLLGP